MLKSVYFYLVKSILSRVTIILFAFTRKSSITLANCVESLFTATSEGRKGGSKV